ncbi:MAG: PTS sugar transporter subunit IIA [Syntrophales bacterium]|nr:PTS sugar transporter subunit IIA [Syntrophales bacterium]
MNFTEILKRDFILEELEARNQHDVLAELVGVFAKGGVRFDPEAMLQVLLERERLGSTGIGDGIAIPHGKLQGLDEILLSFGRSSEGIAFDAMDGKPVHLFFLLMAPENSAGLHLKILAKISRMLKDTALRNNLLQAKSKEEIWRIIEEQEQKT